MTRLQPPQAQVMSINNLQRVQKWIYKHGVISISTVGETGAHGGGDIFQQDSSDPDHSQLQTHTLA